MGSTFNRLDNFKHIKMKLIAISALAGFAAAEQMLNAMNAQSDECAGCEVAPAPVFTCFGESCSDVECGNMAAIADEEGNPTASVECALPEPTTPTPTTAEATASAVASTTSTALATESHLSTSSAQRAPSTALDAVASTRLWPRELASPVAAASTPLWSSTSPTAMVVAND